MAECRGRKPKYLTVDRFETFVSNEFWHVQVKVNALLWLCGIILAAIIAAWAVQGHP